MGKSSGPEAAVVVVSLRNFFFSFSFFARSTTWFVRANRFISLLFRVPLFIQFSSDFSFFFLSASKRFHSNDAQWIAHLSTKSDGAIEKEKGEKTHQLYFLLFLG
jgi:hypothetical protein